jgi:hypothetical protein
MTSTKPNEPVIGESHGRLNTMVEHHKMIIEQLLHAAGRIR